jgi:hypothetical protein
LNEANSPQPSWTFKLEHADALSGPFSPVEDSDVVLPDGAQLGANGAFVVVTAHGSIARVGYVGQREFVRLIATPSNSPGTTFICAHIVGELSLTA